MFSTALWVSDRNVINTQLQEVTYVFERKAGVVATITRESGTKSSNLAEALAGGKKIIVCAIQTLPFALAAVQDGGEIRTKDIQAAQMSAKAGSGGEPSSKTFKALNTGLEGDIRATFNGPDYQVLILANEFQTGFDQPLLCCIYVDRWLAGIQAVQTLSRLNRAYQAGGVVKDTTYILDVGNSADDILAAFKTYHKTAQRENVTDPNQVLDLQAKLGGLGYCDDFEVDRVVMAELNPKASHAELSAALGPVADRLWKASKAARQTEVNAKAQGYERAATEAKQTQATLIVFISNISAFLRLYVFLSQIFNYGSTAVKARNIFRRVGPLLEFGGERDRVDHNKVELTHPKRTNTAKMALILDGAGEKLQPTTDTGSASA